MTALQHELAKNSQLGNDGVEYSAHMNDLMEILDEVHMKDLTDGDDRLVSRGSTTSTKVKRTRYAI